MDSLQLVEEAAFWQSLEHNAVQEDSMERNNSCPSRITYLEKDNISRKILKQTDRFGKKKYGIIWYHALRCLMHHSLEPHKVAAEKCIPLDTLPQCNQKAKGTQLWQLRLAKAVDPWWQRHCQSIYRCIELLVVFAVMTWLLWLPSQWPRVFSGWFRSRSFRVSRSPSILSLNMVSSRLVQRDAVGIPARSAFLGAVTLANHGAIPIIGTFGTKTISSEWAIE